MKIPANRIPKGPPLQDRAWRLEGGLDQVSGAMAMPPGRLLDAINVDIPDTGGYRTGAGVAFERYDGRPRPSDASVTLVQAGGAPFAGTLAVGDVINGQTSGVTATVIYLPADMTWLAATKASGQFTTGENIRKGVTVLGTAADMTIAVSRELENQLVALAAAVYRADITAVPGSGSILGVFEYLGTAYAIRNNVGATAAVLHRATVSGWQAVAFGEEISFTGANASVNEGDTLTQGAVTATVARIAHQSGDFGAGTAAGRLVITARAGGNFAAGAATTTGGGALTLSGAQAAITWAPGGKYDIDIRNFFGTSATRRVYGASGVHRAFEFDGTNVVPISTGMAADTPSFVREHKKHLALAFGASLQLSAIGNPFSWTLLTGAAEIATGGDITGLERGQGNEATAALVVTTEQATAALYGSDSASWDLQNVAPEVGARSWTLQTVSEPIYLDDLGVTTVSASQAFGNFQVAAITDLVRKFLAERVDLALCSAVVRQHNQYKLFFSDGSGITLTFRGRKMIGAIPFSLPRVFNVAAEAMLPGNTVLAGGTDGYVYELGRGRSFDGEAIGWQIRLPYNNCGTPGRRKNFKRISFDVTALGYHTLQIGYLVGRGDADVDSATATRNASAEGQGAGGWDDPAAGWDAMGWDGDLFAVLGAPLDVTSTDISLILSGTADDELSMTITNAILSYIERGPDRRPR